jgi:hypothetical protein
VTVLLPEWIDDVRAANGAPAPDRVRETGLTTAWRGLFAQLATDGPPAGANATLRRAWADLTFDGRSGVRPAVLLTEVEGIGKVTVTVMPTSMSSGAPRLRRVV